MHNEIIMMGKDPSGNWIPIRVDSTGKVEIGS